ncbi:MAG: hypothetical protein ACUVTP_07955 [Candidatus Fervidibacter sp.]|uniref:hypothetical protein n=1 Tax=Candidatus Fervidibacter sp. TaxID=3100871 RepID=UPI00404BA1A9
MEDFSSTQTTKTILPVNLRIVKLFYNYASIAQWAHTLSGRHVKARALCGVKVNFHS